MADFGNNGIGEALPGAPEVSFTYDADQITATFTDQSADRNDDIVSWDWSFGDGAISSEQNPVHTFAALGNYEIMLTVSDAEGLNSSAIMLVSVSSTNTSADMVDIFRNGLNIDTVENAGIYRDRERRTTGSQFIYQICDATTACSNEVTVNV